MLFGSARMLIDAGIYRSGMLSRASRLNTIPMLSLMRASQAKLVAHTSYIRRGRGCCRDRMVRVV
jgi:hypothetical protein